MIFIAIENQSAREARNREVTARTKPSGRLRGRLRGREGCRRSGSESRAPASARLWFSNATLTDTLWCCLIQPIGWSRFVWSQCASGSTRITIPLVLETLSWPLPNMQSYWSKPPGRLYELYQSVTLLD